MPSRKLERKSGSLELTETIRLICKNLEKKIRNLEKRKGKLDTYRNEISQGKSLTLNEDQKIAVIKCDEVAQTLTFTKELLAQLVQASDDVSKIMYRQAKFRNTERRQRDMVKIREILIVQDVLGCLGDESTRNDFLEGENGALKLSQEKLDNLDTLYKLITPCRVEGDDAVTFDEQLTMASTHLAELINLREKDILGTTYKELMELILEVHNSDYFKCLANSTRKLKDELKELPALTEEEQTSLVVSSEPVPSMIPISEPSTIPDDDQEPSVDRSVEPSVLSKETDIPLESLVEDGTVFSTFTQSTQFKEIISNSQNSFNFLLESQIELNASDIDPAVLSIHSTVPPTAAITYSSARQPIVGGVLHYSLQRGINESHGQHTDQEANPSVSGHQMSQFLQPSQITPHIPATNFSQTIPSQTFTNQTFVSLQSFAAALYGQAPQPQQPLCEDIFENQPERQEPKKHLMNVNATTFESLTFKKPESVEVQKLLQQNVEDEKNQTDLSSEPKTTHSTQYREIRIENHENKELDRLEENVRNNSNYEERPSYNGYNNKNNGNASGGGGGRSMNRFSGGSRTGRGYSNGYYGHGGRSSTNGNHNNNNNSSGGGGRNSGNYQNNFRNYYKSNSYSQENGEVSGSSNGNYNSRYRRRETNDSGGNGLMRGTSRAGMNDRDVGGNNASSNRGANYGNLRSGFNKVSDSSV